jgi:CHRD domain/PEP-CTERM motif
VNRLALSVPAFVFLTWGAQAATLYTATLNGATEVPPNASSATGSATLTLTGDLLAVSETFSGLTGGPAAAAHIHCCVPPGTNAPVVIPFPVFPNTTSGTYSNTFDLTMASVYTSAFLTASGGAAGAEATLIAALNAGHAYLNIHNAEFPGGEIEGFATAATPEPGSMLLLGFGIAALSFSRRRFRA